jgi:hypothetical protein
MSTDFNEFFVDEHGAKLVDRQAKWKQYQREPNRQHVAEKDVQGVLAVGR